MGGEDNERADDVQMLAWVHRQNIQRYRSLLRNPASSEGHDQIRKLLEEEEEKLRSLTPK